MVTINNHPERDREVGRRLQQKRERARLSQTDVAELMRNAGYSFQQQTIVKLENGSRPLRFNEAMDMAAILHIDVRELATEPAVLAARNVDRSIYELAGALGQGRKACRALQAELALAPESAEIPAWVFAAADMTDDHLLHRAKEFLDGDLHAGVEPLEQAGPMLLREEFDDFRDGQDA